MSNNFRTTGHDIAPPPPKKHQGKPGELPEHRIPVYDHKGHRRGHVGYRRRRRRSLRRPACPLMPVGRIAWISPPPPKGPTHGNELGDARHAQHLRSAKGSVTRSPVHPRQRLVRSGAIRHDDHVAIDFAPASSSAELSPKMEAAPRRLRALRFVRVLSWDMRGFRNGKAAAYDRRYFRKRWPSPRRHRR